MHALRRISHRTALKLLSILLTGASIITVLSGCSSSKKENLSHLWQTTVAPDDVTGGIVPDIQDIIDNLDIPDTTTPTDSPSEEENPLSIGRFNGGTYINSYIGISCKLDDSWTFYSAEDLQDISDAFDELIDGTELGEMLEGVDLIKDMQADNATQLTSININLMKLSPLDRIRYSTRRESEILDAALEEQDTLKDSYAAVGLSIINMEKKAVRFCNEERYALHTTADFNGTPYYTLQLFDYTLGDYSATITVASFLDDNTNDLLSLFEAL